MTVEGKFIITVRQHEFAPLFVSGNDDCATVYELLTIHINLDTYPASRTDHATAVPLLQTLLYYYAYHLARACTRLCAHYQPAVDGAVDT